MFLAVFGLCGVQGVLPCILGVFLNSNRGKHKEPWSNTGRRSPRGWVDLRIAMVYIVFRFTGLSAF